MSEKAFRIWSGYRISQDRILLDRISQDRILLDRISQDRKSLFTEGRNYYKILQKIQKALEGLG